MEEDMNGRSREEDPRAPARAGVVGSVTPHDPAAEWRLDDILDDSFPASDPPPWTLGVVKADLPSRVSSPDGRAR
jgi:hypothetical protein